MTVIKKRARAVSNYGKQLFARSTWWRRKFHSKQQKKAMIFAHEGRRIKAFYFEFVVKKS